MFILMLMVIYGSSGELSHPGAILPGIVGALADPRAITCRPSCRSTSPGLVLIGPGDRLFIVDVFPPRTRVERPAIVAFFLGAMMLFSISAGLGLATSWIIRGRFITAAFFVFVVSKEFAPQFNPVRAGKETMPWARRSARFPELTRRAAGCLSRRKTGTPSAKPRSKPASRWEVTASKDWTLKVKPKN